MSAKYIFWPRKPKAEQYHVHLPKNCFVVVHVIMSYDAWLLWSTYCCNSWYLFCFQQQRRQLTDCAFQWAELQEVLLGEESDLHDNRIFLDERARRSDRRQVKMNFCFPRYFSVITWKCSSRYLVGLASFFILWKLRTACFSPVRDPYLAWLNLPSGDFLHCTPHLCVWLGLKRSWEMCMCWLDPSGPVLHFSP